MRCQLDWVKFPSPRNGNALLIIHFLANQIRIQFNPIEKIQLGSFIFLR